MLIYIDNKKSEPVVDTPPNQDADIQLEVISTKVPEALAALAKE